MAIPEVPPLNKGRIGGVVVKSYNLPDPSYGWVPRLLGKEGIQKSPLPKGRGLLSCKNGYIDLVLAVEL